MKSSNTHTRKFHLIVPCTSRKRRIYGSPTKVSSLSAGTHEHLAKLWFEELKASDAVGGIAKRLYGGGGWQIIQQISSMFDEQWVLSAGYGLINAESEIKPYDITFSSGSDCSLPKLDLKSKKEANNKWWGIINDGSLNKVSYEGGIKGLIRKNPEDRYLIIASSSYLDLIANDVEECISRGWIEKDNIVVISSCQTRGFLGDQTVIVDSRLREYFRCTLVNLNYHVASMLLKEVGEFSVSNYRAKISSIEVNESVRKEVNRVDDQEVLLMIEKISREHGDQAGTASKALSLFRKRYHLSCEQRRFSALYKKFKQNSAS